MERNRTLVIFASPFLERKSIRDMATAGISDSSARCLKVPRVSRLLPAIVGLTLGLVSAPWTPAGSWTQCGVDTVAWLLFIAGGTLRWWSAIYRNSDETSGLLNAGPYSVCRFPQELGLLAIGCSLAFFMGSMSMATGLGISAFLFLWSASTTDAPERRSASGLEAASELERTRGFWPRPKLFRSPDTVFVDLPELAAELRWTALWLWVPVVGKLLAQFRVESWWPHLLHLP